MHSLNTLWLKKYKNSLLIFILSLTTGLFCLWPLLQAGVSGAFYVMDPDVVYVANALSYIQTNQIHYFDHPGTPTIVLISLAFSPLRVFTKLILHTSFIKWSFVNFDFLMLYARVFQVAIFTLAIYMFLIEIEALNKKVWSVLLGWGAILAYENLLHFGSVVGPENTLFFVYSVWLMFFTRLLNKYTNKNAFFITIVSGIAMAIKFTSGLLLVVSLIVILFNQRLNVKLFIARLLFSVGSFALGLILGILPIIKNYNSLISWAIRLLTFSQVHGSGKNVIFDSTEYIKSIKGLYFSDQFSVSILLLLIASWIFSVNKSKTINLILITDIIFIFIFAKFPLNHYQIINYLMAVTLLIIISKTWNKLAKVFVLSAILSFAIFRLSVYSVNINKLIVFTKKLENFIQNNNSNVGTLWYFGEAKDFAVLWSRVWAGNLFNRELNTLRPDLVDYSSIPKDKLFSVCWDSFYFKKTSLSEIEPFFVGMDYSIKPILGTNEMMFLKLNKKFPGCK